MGTADPLPGAGLLAAVAGLLFAGNLRQLGKGEEGNAAVSDDLLLERSPQSPKILMSRLTLGLPPSSLSSE
jgi:hypothetical protein